MYICDIVTCTCIYNTHVHVLMTKITVFFHIHNYLPSSSCLFPSICIIVFSPLHACIFLKTKASPSGEVRRASPEKGRPDGATARMFNCLSVSSAASASKKFHTRARIFKKQKPPFGGGWRSFPGECQRGPPFSLLVLLFCIFPDKHYLCTNFEST